jgi:hypothetical protein
MSYPAPHPSYSQFEVIFDAALKDYAQKTEMNLTTHPLAAALEACNSRADILDVLCSRAQDFDRYQKIDWTIQLKRHLGLTINILVGLSTSLVFAEGVDVSLVRTLSLRVSSNSHLSSYRISYQRRRYLPVLVSCSQCVSSPAPSVRYRDDQVL